MGKSGWGRRGVKKKTKTKTHQQKKKKNLKTSYMVHVYPLSRC